MNAADLKNYLYGAREQLGQKFDNPERWFFPVVVLPDEAKPLLHPNSTGVFIIQKPDGLWDLSL